MNLLAQVGWGAGWSFAQILILVVVIAGACAVVFIALREFGTPIPAWVVNMFWVVVVCFVAIMCIRLILSM